LIDRFYVTTVVACLVSRQWIASGVEISETPCWTCPSFPDLGWHSLERRTTNLA